MKLNARIIIQRLSEAFSFEIQGKLGNFSRAVLSRPTFLTEKSVPQDGQIWVKKFRKNDELLGEPLDALLIMQGPVPTRGGERFACVLVFEEKENLHEVVDYIHAIFNQYDDWHRDMADMVLGGCSLTKLLDRSLSIFGNPIMITDSHLQLIAYSSIIDTLPKLHILLEQAHSIDLANNYHLYRDFRDTYVERSASFFKADYTGIRTAYKNIFSGNQVLCRVIISETLRPLVDSDLTLLDQFSEYVHALLLQEQRTGLPPMSLSRVLRSILMEAPLEEYVAEKTLQAFNWTQDCEYCCIKLETDYVDTQNRASFAIIRYLEAHISFCCAIDVNQGIAAFINLTRNGNSAEAILHDLTPFITDGNLRAGVSNISQPPDRAFLLLYRQACAAREIGNRYFSFQWVHRFADVCDKYLLERCLSEFPASMVSAPEIKALFNYDKQHNTDYVHTLKTYLDNNMQARKTSEQLYIHRTTFLYRMEKIAERFHIHLENPQKRFYYHLSIMLLENAEGRCPNEDEK